MRRACRWWRHGSCLMPSTLFGWWCQANLRRCHCRWRTAAYHIEISRNAPRWHICLCPSWWICYRHDCLAANRWHPGWCSYRLPSHPWWRRNLDTSWCLTRRWAWSSWYIVAWAWLFQLLLWFEMRLSGRGFLGKKPFYSLILSHALFWDGLMEKRSS